MANKRILQISPCILLQTKDKDAVYALGWVSVQTITTDGKNMIANESYSIFNYKNPIITFEDDRFVLRDIDTQTSTEMNSHWGDMLWITPTFYETWTSFTTYVGKLDTTALSKILDTTQFLNDREKIKKEKKNNGNHYGQFK